MSTYTWDGGAIGNWNNQNNWKLPNNTRGLPATTDDILIQDNAVITLDTTADVTVASFTVDSAVVGLDLNGHNLTDSDLLRIKGTDSTPGKLILGNTGSVNKTFTVTAYTGVADLDGGRAELDVTGAHTFLAAKQLKVGTGFASKGSLQILSGATVSALATGTSYSAFGGDGFANATINGTLHTNGIKIGGHTASSDSYTTINVTGHWQDDYIMWIGDPTKADRINFAASTATFDTQTVLAQKGTNGRLALTVINTAWTNAHVFTVDGAVLRYPDSTHEGDHPITMELRNSTLNTDGLTIGNDNGNASFSAFNSLITIAQTLTINKKEGASDYVNLLGGTTVTALDADLEGREYTWLTVAGSHSSLAVAHDLNAGSEHNIHWHFINVLEGGSITVGGSTIVHGWAPGSGFQAADTGNAWIITVAGSSSAATSYFDTGHFTSTRGNYIKVIDGGHMASDGVTLSPETAIEIRGASPSGSKSEWQDSKTGPVTMPARTMGNGILDMNVAANGGTFVPGDYYDFDIDGNIVANASPTNAFGTLTLAGDLNAAAGFTLDTALGSSSQASLLAVTGSVTLGGNLANQFHAASLVYNGTVAAFAAGTAFAILEAGSISGSFKIPLYNDYNLVMPSSAPLVDYKFGDAIPLGIAQADLPPLASGLRWVLDKQPTTFTVDGVSYTGEKLVLKVVNASYFAPQIVDISTNGYYANDITLDANLASTQMIYLYGERRTRINGSMSFSDDNGQPGNWNLITGFSNSYLLGTADTSGHYHITLSAALGFDTPYRFKLVAKSNDNLTFGSDTFNYTSPAPAYDDIGLSFKENERTEWNGTTLVQQTNNSYSYAQPNWTDDSVHFIEGWIMRTTGNLYGDEWTGQSWTWDPYAFHYNGYWSNYYGYGFSYYGDQALPTWLNGSAEVEFIAFWHDGSDNLHYAHATANPASEHASYSSASGNGLYTLYAFEDGYASYGFGWNGFYQSWNATESGPTSTAIINSQGFAYHTAELIRIAHNDSTNEWTLASHLGTELTPAAPASVSAYVVTNADGINPLAVNLSWQDESDNEAGFQVERGIYLDDSTNVTWTALASVVGTSFTDNTLDWQNLSAYSVQYRVSAMCVDSSSSYGVVSGPIAWKRYIYTTTGTNLVLQRTDDGLELGDGGAVTSYPSDTRQLTLGGGSSGLSVTVDQSGYNLNLPHLLIDEDAAAWLTVDGGSFVFNDDLWLTAPHLAIAGTNNAQLTFNAPQSLTTLVLNSSTTAVLNANMLTGSISGTGTLTLAAGSKLTSQGNMVIGKLVNNGTLVFDADQDILLSSTVTGTGNLERFGTGNFALTGNYQATGDVLIDAGTANETITLDQAAGNLHMARLDIVGTGHLTLVVSGGTFVFDHDYSYAAPHLTIVGKNGAALTFNASQTLESLVLEGTAAATLNAVMTTTIVSAPTLSFGESGSLTSGGGSLEIAPGDYYSGQRDGNGTLTPTSSPTNPFGTMTIRGDLDFSGTAVLYPVVGVSGTGGSQSSLLVVTGSVHLGDSLGNRIWLTDYSNTLATTAAPGRTFTILTAGTIDGAFSDFEWGGLYGLPGWLPQNRRYILDVVPATFTVDGQTIQGESLILKVIEGYSSPIVTNPSFEMGGSGWSFDGDAGITDTSNPEIPAGMRDTYAVVFGPDSGGSISQWVTMPAGTFVVAYRYQNTGGCITVYLDGNAVDYNTQQTSPRFQDWVSPTFTSSGGTHLLTITGVGVYLDQLYIVEPNNKIVNGDFEAPNPESVWGGSLLVVGYDSDHGQSECLFSDYVYQSVDLNPGTYLVHFDFRPSESFGESQFASLCVNIGATPSGPATPNVQLGMWGWQGVNVELTVDAPGTYYLSIAYVSGNEEWSVTSIPFLLDNIHMYMLPPA